MSRDLKITDVVLAVVAVLTFLGGQSAQTEQLVVTYGGHCNAYATDLDLVIGVGNRGAVPAEVWATSVQWKDQYGWQQEITEWQRGGTNRIEAYTGHDFVTHIPLAKCEEIVRTGSKLFVRVLTRRGERYSVEINRTWLCCEVGYMKVALMASY